MEKKNSISKSIRNSGPPANPAKRRRRRGATLLEFTLLGIPAMFLCTSVLAASVDMWQFFTLSYAVAETARYASVHGATCSANSNSCTITRAQVASFFEGQSIALATANTILKLTDGSGTITCNPVTSCPSNTLQFPASGDNAVGSAIKVSATYPLTNPIFMLWPGSGHMAGASFTVGATSTQEILF
jgi:Flp pilus assembly protein TadG